MFVLFLPMMFACELLPAAAAHPVPRADDPQACQVMMVRNAAITAGILIGGHVVDKKVKGFSSPNRPTGTHPNDRRVAGSGLNRAGDQADQPIRRLDTVDDGCGATFDHDPAAAPERVHLYYGSSLESVSVRPPR